MGRPTSSRCRRRTHRSLCSRLGRAALQRRVATPLLFLSSRGGVSPRGICFFYPLPTIHYPLPYEIFRVRHGRVTSFASAMLRMILDVVFPGSPRRAAFARLGVVRRPHSTRPPSLSQRKRVSGCVTPHLPMAGERGPSATRTHYP